MRRSVSLTILFLLLSVTASAVSPQSIVVAPIATATRPHLVSFPLISQAVAAAPVTTSSATTSPVTPPPATPPVITTPATATTTQPTTPSLPATQSPTTVVAQTANTAPVVATTNLTPTPPPAAQAQTPPPPAPTPAPIPLISRPPTPTPVVVTPDMPLIDTTSVAQGIVTVNFTGTIRSRLEVRRGETRFLYNLLPGQQHFPLQLGDGQYTVTVFENTTGNLFRVVERQVIDVTMASPATVFLASIQMINWHENSLAAQRARILTAGLASDRERLTAIWRFVVDNIDYDAAKLATLTSTYLPDVDETLTTRTGICYDFAALMAAMLRSVGVPTKLVKGYAVNVQGFHAWNEVFIDGQWVIVDTSIDAQRRARGAEFNMIKNDADFTKTQEF